MDPVQTDLPMLTMGQIMDLTEGPHGVEESPAYLSGYEEAIVREEHGQGGQYVDEATYHAAAAAFPRRIRAFIFHQAAPPVGWYDGNGVPRPGFGQWEPCDILLGAFHLSMFTGASRSQMYLIKHVDIIH